MKKKNKSNRYKGERRFRLRYVWYFIRSTMGLALLAAVVLALSAAFAHAYYSMLDAPWPRLKDVRIEGLRRLEKTDVLNALSVARNTNVLNLRVPLLAKRLEVLPWVRSSSVRLDLPARLVVEVVEREPMAVVCADSFFLMDTQGKLFLQVDPQKYSSLPMVTGFSGSGLKVGDFLSGEALEVLKNLLHALEKSQSWLPLNHISQFHWQREIGFVLYTDDRAIPIQLGKEDFELKLGRLQRVLAVLVGRQLWDSVTRIDMDYDNRAFVKGRFPVPKGI